MNESKWDEIKMKIKFWTLKTILFLTLEYRLKLEQFMNKTEWTVMVIQGTLTEEEEGWVQLTSLYWYIVL
jgi:hypothetical protein